MRKMVSAGILSVTICAIFVASDAGPGDSQPQKLNPEKTLSGLIDAAQKGNLD